MTRDDILELIPHAGPMCLLDEVVTWDAQDIHCRSSSHRNHDHPLRHGGRLSAAHLIEYGAQAVAVHGGLLARARGERGLAAGLLAAVRDIEFGDVDISRIDSSLEIGAHVELSSPSGLIYRFTAHSGHRLLADGHLTISEPRTTFTRRDHA